MSIPRQTEILEDNVQEGWTSEKITATGSETKTVKSSPGKVAMIYVADAEDVTLKDDDTAKWEAINNTSQDFSNCPIQCDTSIKLTFGGAADAWIIYK